MSSDLIKNLRALVAAQQKQIRLLRESCDLHAERADIQSERHALAERREQFWLRLLCLCVAIAGRDWP